MIWKVEVSNKEEIPSLKLAKEIKDLGIEKDLEVYYKRLYFIETPVSEQDVNIICRQLLIDPVIERYRLDKGFLSCPLKADEIIIIYNPGVCDPIALSLEKAIRDLSLDFKNIRTGRYYKLVGLPPEEIKYIAEKILYNPLIEHILDHRKVKGMTSLDEFVNVDYKFDLVEINILKATDDELTKISQEGNLSLTLDEMRIVKDYFKKLSRNPTDCELETIAQTWSEHCAHKTFRGKISYVEKDSKENTLSKELINNLLKSTVMKATKEIDSCDCVSVFEDNSGIVKFDDNSNICFKVETHNHPSSLEPYGGASTGIGGVIRDILGTGQAARPIANVDIFCFADWHLPYKDLPKGLLHPKRIIKGVVKGVRDYGNKMGIPTVSGAVLFDERFLGNPLVYCGTVGILPLEKSFKKVEEGHLIILCGARTGRDGIHGATFSSVELSEETVALTSAVQIGNPIEEKKLVEAIIRARGQSLFSAITDCGAGGLSSAVGELAKDYGAQVFLDRVPLKYKGLSYTEIWISESQERMIIFAKEGNLSRLKAIFEEEEVELTVIGKVTNNRKLVLFYDNGKVADLDMDFLHNIPDLEKTAVWIKKDENDFKLKEKENYNEDLKTLLSSPNISPKDWIVREYDHEVQAQSVIKPILGFDNIGLSDAAVIRPNLGGEKCVAIGIGINPFYSDIDPYWMSALAIDEALRNIICVGGSLKKTYILDNFSWGSVNDEVLLGGLVRAAKACFDFSTYFGIPFISGKDSLYNEYVVDKRRISIPGTLLISAISVIDNFTKTISGDFKKEGNLIYLIGQTHSHLGASEYFRRFLIKEGIVPKVDRMEAKDIFSALSGAINKGLVSSCHDCSEGGLAVAVAEMCLAADKGATVFLGEVSSAEAMLNYEILFSETPSRFIVEVDKGKKDSFEKEFVGLPWGLIGCVSEDKKIIAYNRDCKEVISLGVEELRESWLAVFEEFR